ncbi:MAG: HlyC/CorC family transporter, partial [Candidatus Eisenbacteria bacterium]|nr:HlyC/CorC family transporter [Candidatus Eisenbacteria bacterium]
MWGVELIVMLAMIAVNSFFAGYEIALASVTLGRLQLLAGQGRRGARAALYMKQNMEASLAVVQVGITLVAAIAAAVGGAGAEESIAPALVASTGMSSGTADAIAIAIVVVPLTVVTIVFGELIPKVFALRNVELVCLRLSPFMRGFALSVWPAVWLFETVVTAIMTAGERIMRRGEMKPEAAGLQELRATAALARASRLIGAREEHIILGAADMRARPVSDIMLPAENISTLDAGASLSDNLIAAHLDMHTRFPVVERTGDPQSIVGYVNVKDIVATLHLSPAEPSLRSIIRPLPSVKDTQAISECLEQLMHQHTHLALVRDDEDRILGMISLEDVLEELVGDIEDEYDRLSTHVLRSGPAWVVGGGVTLARLKDTTGVDLSKCPPRGGANTLNGWLAGHLGRDVRGGDLVERGGFRVMVRKVRRNKVQEAQLGASISHP